MPIIRVEMLSGRSANQKKALVRELTEAFVKTAGGNPDAIHVVISEVEPSDWAAGGTLYSDKTGH